MAPSSKLARREEFTNSATASAPLLPFLAIRGYLCFRCLEHKEKLSLCKGCQRAVYCSKECQITDWRLVHRHHCKLLRCINERQLTEDHDSRSWEAWTEKLLANARFARVCAGTLSAAKSTELQRIVAGQPYCVNCHLSGIQLVHKGATLEPCTTCHLTATCSRCPSSHSDVQCRFYETLGALESFRLERFEKLESVLVIQPVGDPVILEQYRPLSSYRDWSDYFDNVPVRALAMDDTMESPFHQVTATDSSTITITVVAALEASVPNLIDKEEIVLHLVGATSRELQHLMLFEDILHWLPRLKRLRIVLCGPSTPASPPSSNPDQDNEMDLGCCPECESMGRTRSVVLHKGIYHEYARRSTYTRPDLAVLFHSGRSQEEVESWAPTTRFLVDSGTRTLCTTYTEKEATEEADELEQLNASFLIRPEENKWRGLAPYPELLEGREHSSYFQNYYWYIFQGKGT